MTVSEISQFILMYVFVMIRLKTVINEVKQKEISDGEQDDERLSTLSMNNEIENYIRQPNNIDASEFPPAYASVIDKIRNDDHTEGGLFSALVD